MTLMDVIYINYNSTKCLIHSIESLFKQNQTDNQLNVIVIDNSSKDDPHRLKDLFPDIRLIFNKKNVGFGAAINQVLPYCSGKYTILLNPDTLILPGFFDSALTYMEKHPDVGILGPRILNFDGSLQGSARSFPDLLTPFFGRTSPLTRLFPRNSISRRNVLTLDSNGITPIEPDWVSGACMLVRREAIDEVGCFDERFFMYWEDADWCRRMWEQGWKVVYFPQVTVLHLVGASSSKRIFKSVIQFHRSMDLLFKKYSQPGLKLTYPFGFTALIARLILILLIQFYHYLSKSSQDHENHCK